MADIIRPIEPFELTQGFGSNPALYAKFGLAGHNGWDLKTKYSDSPLGRRYILASWLSEFYRRGIDPPGYGTFFEVVVRIYATWKLTYAHCFSIEDFKSKTEGQSMAISDNTGNSTGAHLHLTVKRINIVGGKHQVQNYNNGYFGAINPQEFFNEVRRYKADNNKPQPVEGLKIELDEATFTRLVTKSGNRDETWKELGLSEEPVNAKADDAIAAIKGYKNQISTLEKKLTELTSPSTSPPGQPNQTPPTDDSQFKPLFTLFGTTVYVKKGVNE